MLQCSMTARIRLVLTLAVLTSAWSPPRLRDIHSWSMHSGQDTFPPVKPYDSRLWRSIAHRTSEYNTSLEYCKGRQLTATHFRAAEHHGRSLGLTLQHLPLLTWLASKGGYTDHFFPNAGCAIHHRLLHDPINAGAPKSYRKSTVQPQLIYSCSCGDRRLPKPPWNKLPSFCIFGTTEKWDAGRFADNVPCLKKLGSTLSVLSMLEAAELRDRALYVIPYYSRVQPKTQYSKLMRRVFELGHVRPVLLTFVGGLNIGINQFQCGTTSY
eukprot:m.37452 g.37452  ORF g.37452 m.37452 type:complete len:268 (-) comp12503_c0_seq1:737-1540(-)